MSVKDRMLVELALLIPAIWILVYFWWTRKYDHWSKKNIPHDKPTFPYGNIQNVIAVKENLGQFTKKLYEKYPSSPMVGFYAFQQPMLILKDTDLIKDVLIKDFNSFAISGLEFHKNVDPMIALNPFGLSGDKWKIFRGILSQAHSVGKLKGMMPSIAKSTKNFIKHVSTQNGKELNIGDLTRLFTVDAVAACAYSAESNSFENPNNPFAADTTDKMFVNNRSILASLFAPWFTLLSRDRLISKRAENFFVELSRTLTKLRSNNLMKPNDLMQLVINHNEGKKPLSDIECAAILFAFFADGTDSASLVMTNLLYVIAFYPEVQEKLRDEIKNKGNNIDEFDYDTINSMEYLDMVFCESIRFHPTVYSITRKCTKNTRLGNVDIEEGTKVFIPITALYNDPNYFPEPEKFKPERFSKQEREKIPKMAFLPFGEGPKICVGQRFASLEIKTGIINLLLNFEISLSSKHTSKINTPDELNSFIHWPKEETFMKFKPF